MADRPLPPAAVAALACPVCRGDLRVAEASEGGGGGVRCAAGHAFDRARQGYVHLAAGAIRHPGDTAVMVEARERVQSAGLFDPLTAALVTAVPSGVTAVLDLGAGTGHHLGAVLRAHDLQAEARGVGRADLAPGMVDPDQMRAGSTNSGVGRADLAPGMVDPEQMRAGSTNLGEELGERRREGPVGIAVDTSKPALRRAARAHPRILAIAADVTGRLPLRDGAVDAAMITFAPRAAAELARVVRSGGTLVVAVPTGEHLAAIRDPLGMLAVPAGKDDQLTEALGTTFLGLDRRMITSEATVDRAMAVDLALMGPAGFHADPATLRTRAEALPSRSRVRIAVTVHTFLRA